MSEVLKLLGDNIPLWLMIILTILLSLIEISPIKLNPWSSIRDFFTRNKKIDNKIDNLINKVDVIHDTLKVQDEQINSINKQIKVLEEKVDSSKNEIEIQNEKIDENKADGARIRILRFGDEILRRRKHTKEHFEQLLVDIQYYEDYCEEHPGYINNITASNIELIKETYRKCLRGESQFLPYEIDNIDKGEED